MKKKAKVDVDAVWAHYGAQGFQDTDIELAKNNSELKLMTDGMFQLRCTTAMELRCEKDATMQNSNEPDTLFSGLMLTSTSVFATFDANGNVVVFGDVKSGYTACSKYKSKRKNQL